MKRYIMEYLDKGRVQQIIFADNMKEAKEKAKFYASQRNIEEYYVRLG
jgi:hypothetical protein